ncbi:2140_t:CDS:2, partial [Gigaspora margarita]
MVKVPKSIVYLVLNIHVLLTTALPVHSLGGRQKILRPANRPAHIILLGLIIACKSLKDAIYCNSLKDVWHKILGASPLVRLPHMGTEARIRGPSTDILPQSDLWVHDRNDVRYCPDNSPESYSYCIPRRIEDIVRPSDPSTSNPSTSDPSTSNPSTSNPSASQVSIHAPRFSKFLELIYFRSDLHFRTQYQIWRTYQRALNRFPSLFDYVNTLEKWARSLKIEINSLVKEIVRVQQLHDEGELTKTKKIPIYF